MSDWIERFVDAEDLEDLLQDASKPFIARLRAAYEEELRKVVGDYSILRDRAGGQVSEGADAESFA